MAFDDDNEGRLFPDDAAPQNNRVRDYRAEEAKFKAEIDSLPDFTMRAPCRWCAEPWRGKGPKPISGQAVIYCANCRRAVYNAPKAETGIPQRVVKTRPDLRDGQRERILERDAGECFLCHRRDGILHIAHALSVKDAQDAGWSEDEYMDDANLYASCEECNLGLKSKSMEALIFLRLIQVRLSRKTKP